MSLCELPNFSALELDKVPAQLDELLNGARAQIAELETGDLTQLLAGLEEIDDRIDKFWSVISHLNGVMNSPELREVYAECQPKLTAYGNEVGQNRALYDQAEALASSEIRLSPEQRTGLEHLLRDFRLAGVALEGEAKERFKAIRLRLSELSTTFQNQVLDATQGWFKHVTDAAELAGVPESALEGYADAAKAKELDGYVISLDVPAYLPVMQYAENRELRRELYEAYGTRASDQGPKAGEWDNSAVMVEILQLRAELAQILGYANYAEVSLAPKMAESPQRVMDFLRELAEKSLPRARAEFDELKAFATKKGCSDLQAWDVPFYSEQLRTERYAISQEELKPYFPAETVQEGLFKVTGQLFGITYERDESADLWHEDARCYHLLRDGEPVATVYTDLFARANKRGGAWMANFCGRREVNGENQLPVAFVTCNFTPPTSKRPSLLTHSDVTTLFHEFGHALHHMLTQVNVLAVSGINGVAWDAVELPSQLLENWCWQPEVIPMISAHYETGQPLPEDMLQKLLAAKNFQSGLQMVRQLEFALFDMQLHARPAPQTADEIQTLLDSVRSEVAVYPVPAFNRFQHGFSHIFAGGYAAGYYSYKWAELLSADVFSRFAEEGVMSRELGQEFVDKLLSRGGSADPMQLFRDFRGRDPQLEPLLRDAGILEDAA